MSFSLNIFTDFQEIWKYSFMQHAFEAATIVAIVAGWSDRTLLDWLGAYQQLENHTEALVWFDKTAPFK